MLDSERVTLSLPKYRTIPSIDASKSSALSNSPQLSNVRLSGVVVESCLSQDRPKYGIRAVGGYLEPQAASFV
jgi:hypothetical protein